MRLIVSLFMIATTLVGVSFKQDELEQRAVLAEETPPTVVYEPRIPQPPLPRLSFEERLRRSL